jgi:hypothetical protein
VQLPLNAQDDTTSDEIVDEVKSYEAECTYRQQYTVRSYFPIYKKRESMHMKQRELAKTSKFQII